VCISVLFSQARSQMMSWLLFYSVKGTSLVLWNHLDIQSTNVPLYCHMAHFKHLKSNIQSSSTGLAGRPGWDFYDLDCFAGTLT